MLKWALVFLLVAILSGILGFGNISGASFEIAKVLFYIFIVIFLFLLIIGLVKNKNKTT